MHQSKWHIELSWVKSSWVERSSFEVNQLAWNESELKELELQETYYLDELLWLSYVASQGSNDREKAEKRDNE